MEVKEEGMELQEETAHFKLTCSSKPFNLIPLLFQF